MRWPVLVASLLALVLTAFAAAASLAEEKPTPRPKWWPDPKKNPFGLPWPPPRPKGWPKHAKWPPPKELADNPLFWLGVYGRNIDPRKDPRLARNGKVGSIRLRYLFPNYLPFDPEPGGRYPGCGLHAMLRYAAKPEKSCRPYPEKRIRALCTEVLDKAKAQRQCVRECKRNPPRLRCSTGRLVLPPTDIQWGCTQSRLFSVDSEGNVHPQVSYGSDCVAHFLCLCMDI